MGTPGVGTGGGHGAGARGRRGAVGRAWEEGGYAAAKTHLSSELQRPEVGVVEELWPQRRQSCGKDCEELV